MTTTTIQHCILCAIGREHSTSQHEDEVKQGKGRYELRQLQNKIAYHYIRKGISQDSRLSGDLPATITLGSLLAYLHPDYAADMQAIADRIGA